MCDDDTLTEDTQTVYRGLEEARRKHFAQVTAGRGTAPPRVTLKHTKGHGRGSNETPGNTEADRLAKEAERDNSAETFTWLNGKTAFT
jgi:hypothetical protein